MNAAMKLERNDGKSITQRLAARFGVPESELLSVLKQTCFRVKGNAEAQATDAQMTALMVVADSYGLNPFTKELYAYPDKQNGIVAVVSVDGWSRIINEHPAMDGINFIWSDKLAAPVGGKPCPEWCESVIDRKDRAKPTVIREYLDETYRPAFKGTGSNGSYEVNGPWQSHTKRMLRHKALIQGARIAFGFAGIYDDDEAQRILEKDITPEVVQMKPAVEAVKSKSEARAPVTHENEAQPPAAEKSADPAASTTQNPMSAGQKKILKAKLTNAGLTDIDLKAKFGRALDDDGWFFDHFSQVQDFCAERAGA